MGTQICFKVLRYTFSQPVRLKNALKLVHPLSNVDDLITCDAMKMKQNHCSQVGPHLGTYYRVVFVTGFKKCRGWQNPNQKSESGPIQKQDVKFYLRIH